MPAIKNLFIEHQEGVYAKLVCLGADYSTIYDLEEQFWKCNNCDFIDFAEKMAGYAITIEFFSQITGYTKETLWNIWKEHVQSFSDGEAAHDTLDEEWTFFKEITCEKDW